jgi:SAM-dependent methyltransferase
VVPRRSVTADSIADAAERSPLRRGSGPSELADLDELRFREEIEPIGDPLRDVPAWIDRKELPEKLEYALERARLRPAGTVVELGAGTCWLGATLALRAEVERVVGIEFSQRRLVEFAPIAMAYFDAPAEKIERVVADFYAHGLVNESADYVFMDAAFHHASDPVRLAGIAYRLLRPGGSFVLHREPTLSLLRRTRSHGIEGEHGSFEHEYDWWRYLRFLRAAGFHAYKAPAALGFRSRAERAKLRAPLSWLNGLAFSVFTYVGRKPDAG